MPLGGGGRGGDPDARRPRRARDRCRRRVRVRARRASAGRTSTRRTPSSRVAPDRGQPRAGRSTDARRSDAAERARAIHERGGRALPAAWRRTRRRCSTPGTRVLTHCNTGGLATGGYGTALGAIRAAWERGLRRARLGRRDAAAAPGRPPDGVGARAARHPVRRDRRRRRGVADGRRRGRLRRHRRRPDRRERRHREQDRHVRVWPCSRATTAIPFVRRRADLDDRPRDADRRGDPDRGARARRGDARASPRSIPPSTSRRPRSSPPSSPSSGVHRAPYARPARRLRVKAARARRGLRDAPLPVDARPRRSRCSPIGGRPMVDRLLESLDPIGFDESYVVTNAKFAGQFREWSRRGAT